VFVVTLFISIILLEIIVRAVPLYPDSFAIHDATLGWRYRPNGSGVWFNVGCPREFTNTVQLNSRGAHDVEHGLAKPADMRRLLILGDSLVAALEVPAEDLFFRRLARQLEANAAAPTEVIAFGFAGYGTPQEYLFYQTEGHTYDPDVVLLLFTPHNDFTDNHPAFAARSVDWYFTRPYFRLSDDGQLIPEPPQALPMPPLHRLLLENSWFYRLMSVRVRQFQPPVTLVGAEYETARAESWRWTFAELAALRDAVAADGARFAVIIDQGLFATTEERAATHEQIAAGLTELGIDSYSLAPRFDGDMEAGLPLRYLCDTHWTPQGHAAAADELLPFVTSLLN
jgi:hypothetical protein